MSNLIIRNNDHYHLVELTSSYEKLPSGNYLLCLNEVTGEFFLRRQEDFAAPKRIYGDTSVMNRWKQAFEKTERNLGVLLSGYKGGGKTLIARQFCSMMSCPVIFITEAYKGPDFENFISNPIFKGSIIFIDEYEKVYNEYDDSSETLLSLMDGIYNTHLLFLLTINESDRISDKLKNRLGRIRYNKVFSSVEDSLVDSVIEDLLENKDFAPSVKEVVSFIPTVSFDILTTIIREMNQFNEPATEVVKHLNLVKEEVYFEGHVRIDEDIRFIYPDKTSLPDGEIEIYYLDKDSDDLEEKKKWPKNRIFLKDYECKKVAKGFVFQLSEDTELYLYPKDSVGLLF